MTLTVEDTKYITYLVGTAVAGYITVRVMLTDLKARVKSLEEEHKDGERWKEKMAEALQALAIVLGKVEQKLEDLDKNVTRMQG